MISNLSKIFSIILSRDLFDVISNICDEVVETLRDENSGDLLFSIIVDKNLDWILKFCFLHSFCKNIENQNNKETKNKILMNLLLELQNKVAFQVINSTKYSSITQFSNMKEIKEILEKKLRKSEKEILFSIFSSLELISKMNKKHNYALTKQIDIIFLQPAIILLQSTENTIKYQTEMTKLEREIKKLTKEEKLFSFVDFINLLFENFYTIEFVESIITSILLDGNYSLTIITSSLLSSLISSKTFFQLSLVKISLHVLENKIENGEESLYNFSKILNGIFSFFLNQQNSEKIMFSLNESIKNFILKIFGKYPKLVIESLTKDVIEKQHILSLFLEKLFFSENVVLHSLLSPEHFESISSIIVEDSVLTKRFVFIVEKLIVFYKPVYYSFFPLVLEENLFFLGSLMKSSYIFADKICGEFIVESLKKESEYSLNVALDLLELTFFWNNYSLEKFNFSSFFNKVLSKNSTKIKNIYNVLEKRLKSVFFCKFNLIYSHFLF